MSHIWTFSEENKDLLQQCLAAAGTPNEDNKWMKMFGPKNLDLIQKVDNTIVLEDSPGMDVDPAPQESNEEDILSILAEFTDPELDLISKFDDLHTKCIKTPKLLVKLAENLSPIATEKLIQHIFDTKTIDNKFLGLFFQYFLPPYIKKDNSRSCTVLLQKTYKIYSNYFNILLKMVLKDLEIENNILNDFILSLNNLELTEFLNELRNIELSSQEFSHNLFNIFTAYKSCNKTDNVQNLIFSLLKNHAKNCTRDKNYGKLFLAFLQHEKSSSGGIDKVVIQSILEMHESPFKRPCLAILKEI